MHYLINTNYHKREFEPCNTYGYYSNDYYNNTIPIYVYIYNYSYSRVYFGTGNPPHTPLDTHAGYNRTPTPPNARPRRVSTV